MANISFQSALGIHEQALHLRTQRAAVLANNLANADTPGFKARDFNFRAMLSSQEQKLSRLPMQLTRAGHMRA